MYQEVPGGRIRHIASGAIISNDPGSRDQIAYQEWLAIDNSPGPANTPLPADPPPTPSYRQLRARAYVGRNTMPGLGKEPGEFLTIGDVLDIILTELQTRGASATAEFQDILDKRAAIKAAYPQD